MDRSQNKNSLCIFCFKPASLQNSSENQNGYSENDFLKLFSRYIQHRQERYKQVPIAELMFCGSCAVTVNAFRDCYSKMELIRLEMESKVQMLLGTMKAADKNPTMLSLFRQQFKSSAHLDGSDTDSDFIDIYSNIKEMRSDLIFYSKFNEMKEYDYPHKILKTSKL